MSLMVPLELRVIYGDTDQMGVVYYANYLRYFEAGRAEYCRARDIAYRRLEEQGFALPVIEVHVKYRKPARYDDAIVVETSVERVGRSRVDFTYEVKRKLDGLLLASGHTVHACVNREGRPVRLPQDVRERLR